MARKWKKSFKVPAAVKVLIVIAVIITTIIGTAWMYEDDAMVKVAVYPEHTGNFYVEDYSGVLNEKTERYIMDEAVALADATTAQVVVVTIPNTQNETLEEFSIHIANKWGIGNAEKDNGVLFLMETDPESPHVRLEVGKGLEGAIPDGKAGRILDTYAVDAKDNGLWNKAAGDTFTAVVKEVYEEYGIECPDTVASEEWEDPEAPTKDTFADAVFPGMKEVPNEEPFIFRLFEAFASIAIIEIMVLFMLFSFFRVLLTEGPGGFFNGSGTSSGGGFGGGGGFSGGGGSFGGGGASR